MDRRVGRRDPRLATDHRSQGDDARDLERLEGRLLVIDPWQVDDDVLTLDTHIRLGDTEALELSAHQIAHDHELLGVSRFGRGVDDR